ncbi:MAG TPA: DUF3048 domain-containing protein [Candidatus Saccharimonadales bacterium]|nr:DUF3048 domain-containing protein [Candidatus Saccharimonadales bacterium]
MDSDFKTPEEAAAESETGNGEAPAAPDNTIGDDISPAEINNPMPKKRESKWHKLDTLNWPPGKKEWIIFIIIVLLLAGGGYLLLHKKKPATLQAIPKVTTQMTVPSTLTGLPVDPIVNKRTVTGVMIENSPQARPQSGLGEAGVVFEAIAEGGVTRFLALYQDTAPDNVGPIRSARPYYEQWNLGFDAGYAHVGGSPEALNDIKQWHVRDLDQFANGGSYHRVGSRAAPHNVYTSISTLSKLEVQKGYVTSHYTGFIRKKKAHPIKSKPLAAKTINLAMSGPTYNVHYDYDAASNSYARSEAGAPHVDANTNKQIKPVVVIALVMPYNLEADGYHSNYATIGSGPVYIFQDGQVITGTWAKTSSTAQFTFKDGSGKIILLNPGQTWLTAVAGTSKVSYSP